MLTADSISAWWTLQKVVLLASKVICVQGVWGGGGGVRVWGLLALPASHGTSMVLLASKVRAVGEGVQCWWAGQPQPG